MYYIIYERKKILKSIIKMIVRCMMPEYLDNYIHISDSDYDFRDVYKLSIPKINYVSYGKNWIFYKHHRFRSHWIVK